MSKYGFLAEDRYLIRCPECGYEHWASEVESGTCAWCGYHAKKEKTQA